MIAIIALVPRLIATGAGQENPPIPSPQTGSPAASIFHHLIILAGAEEQAD